MSTVTITLSSKEKAELTHFSWVNWSEIARIELRKEEERQNAFLEIENILKHSTLTEKNAREIADEASLALAKRYKKKLEQT